MEYVRTSSSNLLLETCLAGVLHLSYKDLPELAGCIFKVERIGLIKGAELIFDHFMLEVFRQEGYPLFLLHKVNSMWGVVQGVSVPAIGTSPFRCIQKISAPGIPQVDRKEACFWRGSAVEKLPLQSIHWIATETDISMQNCVLVRFSLSKSHPEEEEPMCSLSPVLCAGASASSLNLHIFKKNYSSFFLEFMYVNYSEGQTCQISAVKLLFLMAMAVEGLSYFVISS